MLSLNFMRGPKRRAKSYATLNKSRPEIRRVEEDHQLIRSQVSFEVLDINEKSIRSPSVEREPVPAAEQPSTPEDVISQPVSLPSSPAPPTPPSKHGVSPRVEVDLPEDVSSLNDWFPPHLLHNRSSVGPGTPPSEDAQGLVQRPVSVKKHAPSPIKIPNHAFHGPKVQLQRSSIPSDKAQSRPASTSSLDEMSTISGTTLARALIGSNFVFPSDARSSRYRSGMTALARQDSATLPRGEDSLINSPYWRDKRISGGEIVRTPDPSNDIPPVPALPVGLRSRPHSNVTSTSHADSTSPVPPRTSSVNQSEPSSSSVPDSASEYPTTASAYDSITSPASSRQLLSPRSIVTPGSAMDDVLDYYRFAPDSAAQQTILCSPIMEASTSAEASQVPSPYTASSDEIDRSSLASSVRSKGTSHKSSSIKRLPIGESAAKDQKRQSGPNKTGELQPPPRPNFNRGRSGSAPSPIIVVRDSKDFTRYKITVSPVPEAISPLGSPDDSDANSSGKQTFPETPRAFSPLWSAEPVSGGLVQRAASASDVSAAELTRAMSARHAGPSHAHTVHRAASFSTRILVSPPADTPPLPNHVPSPPKGPSPPALTTSHEIERTVSRNSNHSTPSQSEPVSQNQTPPLRPTETQTPSHIRPINISSYASPSTATTDVSSASPPSEPLKSHPAAPSRRPSDAGLTTETDAGGITPSPPYGAPPPYSSVIDLDASTARHNSRDSLASESSFRGSNRRSRARPPLPLGPRRPSNGSTIFSTPISRDRNGSVSSISSFIQTPRTGSTRHTTSTHTPRFMAPPPKYKGLTMDAAKWTFTSEELQNIVSHAIRKSAEASTIRLLPLETIQSELPDELSRLEVQREDLKLRYKLLSRKRFALISSLAGQTEVEPGESLSAAHSRILDELSNVSMQTDQVAEELYSVGEQITHLVAAREVHSYSALAMALRKLNTSFAKQVTDAQGLRIEVETLRQERDAAWEQAERLAHDYDNLVEKARPVSGVPSSSSRRSSRAIAQRRSTIRVQAAMRSSSIVRSRRSSASSSAVARLSMSSMGSASRGHFSIPPVPPIPHGRPQPPVINVNVNPRESISMTESSVYENSAMAQVQRELYEMLGISDERGRLRRRQSFTGSTDTHDPGSQRLLAAAEIRRPSSLPDHTIEDTSSVNTAMLNTLALLAPS